MFPDRHSTGFAHSKCYLGETKNCSKVISREHYISKSVLEQFNGLWIEGLPWQRERTHYLPSVLKAKILCTRHNSVFSPLDSCARLAFQAFREATAYSALKSLRRSTRYFLVNGHGLELWALKTLLGLANAKIAQDKSRPVFGTYAMNFSEAFESLSTGRLAVPLGMHIAHDIGDSVEESLGFVPLLHKERQQLHGLALCVHGLRINFLFDSSGLPEAALLSNALYRPWVIDVIGKHRTSRVIVVWDMSTSQLRRIEVKLGRSNIGRY
jgi:hypothetical protein